MSELGHPFQTLGCPAIRRATRTSRTTALASALVDKAPFVDPRHDPDGLRHEGDRVAGSAARRAEGFGPPVIVGVPGVADPQKLMSIAARIGVKDAKRFLVKNLRFVTGLAKSGGFYKPSGFVEGIAPLLADPAANVTGFHLYTFNAVEATEGWRRGFLVADLEARRS